MDTDSDSDSEDQYELAKLLEQDEHAQAQPGINSGEEIENEIERMLQDGDKNKIK